MEEWEVLEWEQLRVEGKPLLSGAAFGATPLFWVACRAQPCLVHIFCDTQLQDIWRFPADPVFLLIGSGSCLQGEDERSQCNGRLLVITRDGCVWIVPLSKTRASASRPSKRRKTQKVGEIQRVQPTFAKSTISEAPQTIQSCWKELAAKTFTSRAPEVKNVVVVETLLGTVPGATVAAFGPNNHVVLGSPFGYPELLKVNRLAASNITSHPEFLISSSVSRRGPTCLLVVSSVRHSQHHGPGDSQADLSQDLFESLSTPSAGVSNPEILLIQGGMDGKVCTFLMQKGTLVAPPHVVCDLQQPVVTIIPVSYPVTKTGQECNEARGANCLIVVGLLGQVAFLSSVRNQPTLEEPNESPFLARTSIGVEEKCTFKKLVSNEGVISGPITSACLVGGARLCYTVGPVVFITELLGNVRSDGGVENSRSSSPTKNSPMKLPSQRISVTNVAAITGPGLFTYKGTHSLVVLTGAGKLLNIKVSKQIALPLSAGVDCCQDSFTPYSGRSVKVLLQSIADAESCRDAIQSHEQALTLAMNELALALPRARDIATDKKKLAFKTIIPNSSKGETATALGCTLTATPVPSTSLGGDQLSFGGFPSSRKPPNFAGRNMYKNFKTRLDIALINHSRTPLSQYWSCILELQTCLSTASPTSQYSFSINNGYGLPVGFQWKHRIHVNLPGGPYGPVIATMYLCHIHDSHQALLQNSRGSDLGRASSAGCVVLLRQRIDLFSLLQGPQSTLGHTSWTPAFSGNYNSNPKVPSFAVSVMAGMEGIEILDLADSDTLGSFSGDLTWNFSLDAKHIVSKTVIDAADWQNGFLLHLLQQPSTSTEWKRLRLTTQGGCTVAISIDGRGGQEGELLSVAKIQTPCLLLGILLREALLLQLMRLSVEAPSGSGKEAVSLHRSERMNFVARLSEVQALAQRAREALNLWKKFRTHNAPPAQDLVTPLLGHTYVVTAEIIQAYKTFREAS